MFIQDHENDDRYIENDVFGVLPNLDFNEFKARKLYLVYS